MNKSFCLAAFLTLAPLAHASSVPGPAADPCIGADAEPNNWLLSVNEQDAATRDGLLKTLDLVATGGFTLTSVFAYPDSMFPAKTLVISFDPTYWSQPGKADQVKNQVLTALAAIPGNTLGCNYHVYPAPAMGVRN